MLRRIWLSVLPLLILGLATSPVSAQTTPPTPATAAAAAADVRDRVLVETTAGNIVIALDPSAPITAANFLRYVEEKRFDGTDFYRSMVLGPNLGLIQGGTQNAPDRVLPPIAHEPTSETRLSHTDGAISMARNEPGSATGDFFIIVGNVSTLDANRSAPGDPGFAVFGRVIDGMDVVRQILAAPKSPTEGEGFMVGQMLEPRIRIVSARRVEAVAVPQP
ncbi:MAG: peptidylprolyl isomerase [Brevundimonas sp.]|uniref:peptidylprolyl isomerase n=1 Tax=Brevundimonas sp. TaxID=1871086 RepID=UPI0040345E52